MLVNLVQVHFGACNGVKTVSFFSFNFRLLLLRVNTSAYLSHRYLQGFCLA